MALTERRGHGDDGRGQNDGEHGKNEKWPPGSDDGLDRTQPHVEPPVRQTRLWLPGFVPEKNRSQPMRNDGY